MTLESRPNGRHDCPDETSPLLPENCDEQIAGPASVWSEVWLIVRYSVPLIITYLLQYSATVITTIVAGHLSADDLGAASIGLTTMNIIGYAMVEGMATALDTLCAQAYGSGRLTNVGLYVQRMVVLMTATMIPIGAFWMSSPWILPLIVNQPQLAVKAGVFLQVSLIGLPGYAFFEAGKRFLQAQGDFKAGTVVLLICTPLNAVLSWYFTIKLQWGLPGAALAQALCNDLRPILLLLYIVLFAPLSLKCWGGWSRDAFSSWGILLNLSAAGTALNLAEWGAFEILMISTSYIDTKHLAAQTILSTISIISWHIPFSVSVAVSTRFGTFIGAGMLQLARREAALYSIIFIAVGLFDGLFIYLFRNQLASIVSNDAEVAQIAVNAMLAVAGFQIIDAIICGCNAMLRGMGRQSVAAWVVLAINYLGAVPFAIWLELGSPNLKIDGIWIGIGSGMVLIAVTECWYMKCISWQECVDDVRERELEGVE
ncbi:mate-domain-containing protein [Dactylonectria estremocensis]|uniref:Mate-domain-containing protein n=1 Tax=Dactylonectria estremocensis TaxID=1079267 RepID=A0A9P9E8T0_9HYPO|nr:mate-domain-containing protein [Dactylonectria estremocensis]